MGCNFMTFCYYRYMDKLNKLNTQVGNAFAHLDAQEIKQETAYVIETADMVINLAENPVEGYTKTNVGGIMINRSNQQIALENLARQRGIDKDLVGTIRFNRANFTLDEANANIVEMALRPLQAKHEKRNYRIAEKLLKKGVEEFDFNNQEVVWGGDFETTWRVEDFLVNLKVAWAGGHNIQKLHPRVLVNVR